MDKGCMMLKANRIISQGKLWKFSTYGLQRQDTKKKEGLQACLYALMYQDAHPQESIKAGFYSARRLSQGFMGVNGGKIFSNDDFEAVEELLKGLLEEIFDLSVPFIQSEDDKAYSYSAFDVLVD